MNNHRIRQILAVIVLLLAAGWQYLQQGSNNGTPTGKQTGSVSASTAAAPSASAQQAAVAKIRAAADDPDAKFWTTVSGEVVKNLKDDNEGSRHQKFLVDIAAGLTLLVAHNIDLADRADVKPGDRVTLRGEYVWNNRGGVLHWTHHDPKGRREGGWIEVGGKRFE